MRLLALLLISAISLASSSAFAATLNVVGGRLMGASNVLVDGSLYDVQFLDGTCIDLYNGCDEASDFTFQTLASALLASQALLDQVFLDGPSGPFDSDPSLTYQRASSLFLVRFPHGQGWLVDFFIPVGSINSSVESGDNTWPDCVGGIECEYLWSFPSDARYFAVWSPVPEPTTALLLGLGLTGLAGKGRRRNRS